MTFDCVGSVGYNHSNVTYTWLAYNSDNDIIDTSYSVLSRLGDFSYQIYSDIQLDDISFVQCVFEDSVQSDVATITVKGVCTNGVHNAFMCSHKPAWSTLQYKYSNFLQDCVS